MPGLHGIKETRVIAGNELLGAGHEGSGTKLLAQPRARHQPPKRCTHSVPEETRTPRAAPASYPRPLSGSASSEQSTSAHTSLSFFAPGRKRTAILFLHPHGELRNTSTKGRLGEEPTQRYLNRGSFPGEADPGGRASPTHTSPRALGTAGHLSRTHTVVNAVLCAHTARARGDGKSHAFFLLKFQTCCTQRAELTKGKLTRKKEKVQRWVAFLCHLWLKKCF